MVNAPASQVCMHCGLRGPAFAVASACASATHAIGLAFQMVRSGHGRLRGHWRHRGLPHLRHGARLGSVARDGARYLPPVFRRPQGHGAGRGRGDVGAGTARACARRAAPTILAEIVGFGMSADAGDLIAPDVDGMSRAMRGALDEAEIDAARRAIHQRARHRHEGQRRDRDAGAASGVRPRRRAKLAVSSTKSMVGHALGAAGALEAVAAIMAVREGIAPPTIGYLGARSGLRSRLRAERSARNDDRRRAVELVRLWRAQCRAGDEKVRLVLRPPGLAPKCSFPSGANV